MMLNRLKPLKRSLCASFAVAALAFCSASARAADAPSAACVNANLPPAILQSTPLPQAQAGMRLIRVSAPNHQLLLAVADSEKRRELGLMCARGLQPYAGMIFVFGKSGQWEFWMKHTLISLDMVWVDQNGRVTSVAAGVPASTVDTPDDKVAVRSGTGRYVIELRAGDAARAGLHSGVRLALPELHASD
jgi:uncharacterized protein